MKDTYKKIKESLTSYEQLINLFGSLIEQQSKLVINKEIEKLSPILKNKKELMLKMEKQRSFITALQEKWNAFADTAPVEMINEIEELLNKIRTTYDKILKDEKQSADLIKNILTKKESLISDINNTKKIRNTYKKLDNNKSKFLDTKE